MAVAKSVNATIDYMIAGKLLGGLLVPMFGLFAAMPASGSYQLKTYDFGNGGGEGSSTNYRLDAATGTPTGDGSSESYRITNGEIPTQNTNVPPAPTFTNPSNYYNRLHLVVQTGGNPSDTKYVIAISSDDFATTLFVQPDNSIGASFGIANYQTYTAWGGASGFDVLGLQPNTTYKVKLRALQGRYSESAFGPTASAATDPTTISFAATTTLSGSPPFTVNFSGLAPGSVFGADADVLINLSSNALNGGNVYIRSLNGGLLSATASYTLNSASADLSSAASGYGVQVLSTSATSGGPLNSVAPFNGSSNNVGQVTTSLQEILSTSSQITGGSATIRAKAKTDFTVPSTSDYTDRITFIAAMTF